LKVESTKLGGRTMRKFTVTVNGQDYDVVVKDSGAAAAPAAAAPAAGGVRQDGLHGPEQEG